MSTAEFGDPNLGQAPAPAPAPDGHITPLTLSPTAPLEPLVQPAVAAPVEAPAAAPVPVADMRDVPLGTLIFREGLLTEEQLEEALQDGMRRGKRLGEVLLERGLVSENDLGRLLAGQKGLLFVQLDAAAVDPAAVRLLPVEKARLHSVLPIGFQDGLPVVAVADPSNDLVIENVRRSLNCEPRLVVAGREALQRQIELAYAGASGGAPLAAEPVAPVAPVVAAEPVAPVVAPEPVAPVVVPEPVAAVAVEPVAPLAAEPPAAPLAPPAPPVVQPGAVNTEGVWLGTPEPVVHAEPVVQPEPVLQTEPLAPPEPVTHFAPAIEPEPVVQPEPVAQAVPEPLSISYTPVEPPAQPVVEEPAPVTPPKPAFAAEPVLESPAPVVEQPGADPEPDVVLTWYVVLRLADGERLDIGSFHSSAEAKEHAKNVVEHISSDSGWPFFQGRFIRPEGIVSVDLVEPEGRWLGSAARRAALDSGQLS
ncbi:MAG TPA: hypothetical protein VF236_10365 [Gaiellaceae bacterium]